MWLCTIVIADIAASGGQIAEDSITSNSIIYNTHATH